MGTLTDRMAQDPEHEIHALKLQIQRLRRRWKWAALLIVMVGVTLGFPVTWGFKPSRAQYPQVKTAPARTDYPPDQLLPVPAGRPSNMPMPPQSPMMAGEPMPVGPMALVIVGRFWINPSNINYSYAAPQGGRVVSFLGGGNLTLSNEESTILGQLAGKLEPNPQQFAMPMALPVPPPPVAPAPPAAPAAVPPESAP